MRILMLSDFYPPHLGGTERAVSVLSRELSDRGHCVEVATLWHEGLSRREHLDGVLVHRLTGAAQRFGFVYRQATRPFHPPIADPLLVRQLWRLIASMRPDVVHGHSWMLFSALPSLRNLNVAAVATLHDYALVCPKKNLLYQEQVACRYGLSLHCLTCAPELYGRPKAWMITAGLSLARASLDTVDTFTAISSYVASAHQRDPAMCNRRIITIPNFVPGVLIESPPGPPLDELPPDYMLFVGVLSRHKGLHVLLDAYTRLRTEVPLVLIGITQPDTPESFPEGIIVLRDRPHAEIVRAMDHCRFVVSPALWPEPFGLVVIEAMSRAKAVIASKAGGVVDIVNEQTTGLLVSPGSIDALAMAMQALLDDPELAHRMGREGAARCASCFSARAVVSQFERIYDEAWRRRLGCGE